MMHDKEQRAEILRRVEAGEMDVDEALLRLSESDDADVRKPATEVLEHLDSGVIDVDEAIRQLGGEVGAPHQVETYRPRRWRSWWLVPFSIGIVFTVAGTMLGLLGGWWWLAAGVFLVLGIPLMTIAAASSRSPWIHIRIHTRQDRWPRRIAISLPIPVRFSAWLLRMFRSRVTDFEDTAIDELILALDEGKWDKGPMVVEVDEGASGEKVEIYLG
jgi:hypothetical protein